MSTLITCDCCGSEDPDTTGDTRTVYGATYSLCDPCVTDWDTNGAPASVIAEAIG